MKILPVGEQVFEEIRNKDFLYVDKTRFIHEMLRQGKYFFLSRPRRFGKTLLVDTMKCLFEGRRDLFDGLWIADQYNWDNTYPVIKVNFNEPQFREIPLAQAINEKMEEEAARHGITLTKETPGAKLQELIVALASKGQKVALLIDEYDKAITDYLDDLPRARANRDVLKAFFSPLKSLDAHLHFVFVTGISKYGKVSIFSDLNNLDDLTLSPLFAAITGYTQEELETQMAPHLADAAARLGMEQEAFANRMKAFYNGYSWDGRTKVYNPFSVNKFLKHARWGMHWYSTGTPTMLVKLFSKQATPPQQVDGIWAVETLMDKVGLDAPPNELVALLWQTGYLTIQAIRDEYQFTEFKLGFPNLEVKQAFLSNLWQDYALQAGENNVDNRLHEIRNAIIGVDLAAFFTQFEGLMATIPYHLFVKQEAYYHTLIYLVMELSGLRPASEVATAGGRADTVLQTKDTTYVFEFKIDGTAAEALAQIQEKGYHKPYQNQGRQVILVGASFDTTARSLAEWQALVVE